MRYFVSPGQSSGLWQLPQTEAGVGLAWPPLLSRAESKEEHWVQIPAPPFRAPYLPSLNLFPRLQTGETVVTHATDAGLCSVFIHHTFTEHAACARPFPRRWSKTDAAPAGRLEREEDSHQEMQSVSIGDKCFGEREGSACGG